jgi:hypothetical protein
LSLAKRGKDFKLVEKEISIMKSFIRPAITTKLNIFTEQHLVVKQTIIDPIIRESTIANFAEVGWWGFLKNNLVLMVRPEDISSLGIQKVSPQKPLVVVETFTNMGAYHTNSNRKSFEEWLELGGNK